MEQGYIHSIIQNYEEDLQNVKQDGFDLYLVKEQTPEICWAAVKQDGLVLKYVKEQTPELCLAAVKQNRFALQFIKDLQLREHIAHHKDLYKSSIFIPLS